MSEDPNKAARDDAYWNDAVEVAKQFGAKVVDAPAKSPDFLVKGDDAAIEEHIAAGVKRGTITDATKPAVGNGKFTGNARTNGSQQSGQSKTAER